MRTTVNLDDDVLKAVKSLARASGESLGAVMSHLLRQGLAPKPEPATEGFPVFSHSYGLPPLTPEMVREADADFP